MTHDTLSRPGHAQEAKRPSMHAGRFSRRTFLRAAGASLVAAAAGACTSASPTGMLGRPVEKVQLVYQDWRTEWFPALAQEMLASFHATHPNIHVYYVPDPENLAEKMLADMQAGSAADVFQGCCVHFPVWAQKGYCLDLRPFIKADLDRATLDDWDKSQYNALATADGRQFGLPKYHGGLAVYYNKDMLDQAGVEYPGASWTYSDYLLLMRRLKLPAETRRESDRWGGMLELSWDRLQVHVNAWGGHFVDPQDPARCLMAQPEALAALEWVRQRIWEDQVMPSPLGVRNLGTRQAFLSGRVATVEDGSWSLKDILSTAHFRLGVAPMPAGPVRRVTLGTTDGFAIYSGTRHPEAAWELVKFLIGKEYGRAMARTHFLQPARASLVDEWAAYVRAEYPVQTREMDLAAFADGHLKGYSVTTEAFRNMAEAQRLAQAAWDKILVYGEAGIEIMGETCREIERAQQATGSAGGGSCC